MRLAALALTCALAAPAFAQTDPALVARGQALVEGIVACGNCHTPKGPQGDLPGRHLAGGLTIEEPGAFRAVASNITPDPETGIGRWTDAQLLAAIREGRRPDGSLIGPPMPFAFYRNISDADARAIVAYLRSVPPVRNAVERSTFSHPLPPAWGPPVTSVPPPADNAVARGAYLAGPLGHCLDCHTPMNADGSRDMARAGQGGPVINGPAGPVAPPDITPARLAAWSDAEIARAIQQGVSRDGRPLRPPMGYGYYARMTPAQMGDLIAYLRSLPASR